MEHPDATLDSVAPRRSWLPRLPALRYQDFRRLSASSLLNAAGMSGEQITVAWIVFDRTDSSFMVGFALALSFVPMAVLGLPAGAVADWLDRRSLLRWLDTALAAVLASWATLLALDLLVLWHIFAFTFVAGSFRAVYQPVRLSYAYDIVGPGAVVSGLSLVNFSTRGGQLFGAVLAGSFIQRFGPEYAYAGLAGLHAAAVAVLMTIRTRRVHAGTNRQPILKNIRVLGSELRWNRTLLTLLALTGAVEVLGFSFQTALPALARDVLGVDAEGLGIMHAVRSLGGILAILVLSTQGELRRKGVTYVGTLILFGASLVALGSAEHFGLALAALAVVAGMASLSDILTQALMQLSVADHLRGRAMGIWVFAIGTAPLGHLQMGMLAAGLGVTAALTINGAGLIVLAALAGTLSVRLRRL